MKKYDSDARCCKCGSGRIEDEYEKKFKPNEVGKALGATYHPERIRRTCRNCDYSWNEAPLDMEPSHAEDCAKLFMATSAAFIESDLGRIDTRAPNNSWRPWKNPWATEDIPAIEVGDVVHACCPDEECKVLGMTDGNTYGSRCAVQSLKDPWCVCDTINDDTRLLNIRDLTLVRKGPKIHEYLGVKIRPGTNVPFVELDEASWPLYNQGKRHTLKLIEED